MGYPAHQRFDHAARHIEYVGVKVSLANRTDGAILVAGEHFVGAVWIPRQALDHGTKLLVARAVLKTEIEIIVDEKMARAKGLL